MNLEQIIFDMYKDSVIIAKSFKIKMIKKYRLSDEQIRNLYIKIQNYQIENYGNRLTYDSYNYSRQERLNDSRKARQRKYNKKVKRWKEKVIE